MPLSNGATFAGFTIVRLVGSGGMGEVYLAQHPRLPRRDALKLLPLQWSADEGYRARFIREADLASTLWHPHIVGVHDRGEAGRQLWISMDYVNGLDAARLLADRYPAGMPVEDVVRIVTAVASGLDYAHKQGLLHRDVKPPNIMLTHLDDDGDQRILLADFGIARDVTDFSGLTTTNMTVGTVAYAAPEQLMGEDIDGRADQYALAATAYHLLTGSQLFPHSNPAVVISRHLTTAPPTLAGARPDLAVLDPVLAVALAKKPELRFGRCTDFARALAEHVAEVPPPSPLAVTGQAAIPSSRRPAASRSSEERPPAPPSAQSKGSRRRWLIPVAALSAISMVCAVALILQPWKKSPYTNVPPAISNAALPPRPVVPPPVPPPPPTYAARAIDNVLLTPDEVNNTLGTYAMSGDNRVGVMKIDRSTYGMADNSALVKPVSCVGVVFGAEHEVYVDTGFDAIRDETFIQEPYAYKVPASAPTDLEQTAIVFPTSSQAEAVMAAAERQWNQCASGEVDQKAGPESGYGWKLGTVVRQGKTLAVSMASNGAEQGPAACQQVLGIRENVVIGTRSCNEVPATAAAGYDEATNSWPTDPNWANSDAQRLATTMLDKVTN